MIRGKFHIFACRSGQEYAKKLVEQLKILVEQRLAALHEKNNLSLHERDELDFITSIHEDGARLGGSSTIHFDDGELNIQLENTENVRDRDVFLVQCPYNTLSGLTISENLMETFLFIDALKRSKAQSITLISLYYPYGRGDKQHGKDGVPAKMLASLLSNAGLDNLLTMDLHSDQITGFFNSLTTRVDHLHSNALHIHNLKANNLEKTSIVAPDAGAAKRAQFYAQHLKTNMVLAYKRRSYHHKHTVDDLKILGLPDENVVIIDDIVASGGSVLKVIDKLKEKGVKKALVCCTHAILLPACLEKLDKAFQDPDHPFSGLIGTDAIPHNSGIIRREWYTEIDTSRFIAQAVYEIHTSGSLSQLLDPFCVEKLGLWVRKE